MTIAVDLLTGSLSTKPNKDIDEYSDQNLEI